jgi:hypothetical protein
MLKVANGILLIYHHPHTVSAPTIMEHVDSFERYSRFKVWKVNTAHGFPKGIRDVDFAVIVLHYSPFGRYPFLLPKAFQDYVQGSTQSLRIAFFQDEHQYCQERFALIDKLGIEVVYSLLEPAHFDTVYYRNTRVRAVLPTLTGYVCDNFINRASQFAKPFSERQIDVGYRGRSLAYFMGRGAQEKSAIGEGFLRHAAGRKLTLDVATDTNERFHGDAWYRFVGNCRFVLGVEAGVSIFDLDGTIRPKVERYLEEHPSSSFEEIEHGVLSEHEDAINYRTISPRIFEAAGLRTGMILFRGHYQGILKPLTHYIPLEKDFSNIDDVLDRVGDHEFVRGMVQNAYMDLISSGAYHYSVFMREFDAMLASTTDQLSTMPADVERVDRALQKGWQRNWWVKMQTLRYARFPGRDRVKQIAWKLGMRGGE